EKYKRFKSNGYMSILTPVISAKLPLLNSPDVNKTPFNPLYIRLSLCTGVNRLNLYQVAFEDTLGGYYFPLKY
ncbi:TPA: hypothetical protein ACHWTQ_004658, partial [Escherichia coli]